MPNEPSDFDGSMRRLGFVLERESRSARHYACRQGPYLTYWVQALDDGTALFTWEFAIGDFAAELGLQVGSDEHLNSFLFPQRDARGPTDPAWVASQMERTEALLRSVALLEPSD